LLASALKPRCNKSRRRRHDDCRLSAGDKVSKSRTGVKKRRYSGIRCRRRRYPKIPWRARSFLSSLRIRPECSESLDLCTFGEDQRDIRRGRRENFHPRRDRFSSHFLLIRRIVEALSTSSAATAACICGSKRRPDQRLRLYRNYNKTYVPIF